MSPDGRRIVFNRNRAGTRSLHIGDLRDEGVENVRELVPANFMEQAFTPRWSPDGTHVAYSVWKHGGYRDIRYVDVRDGTWRDLTNNRAVDGAPSFSADGRLLYFHSDRTGIMNVYAWELATDRVWQVTNVLTGAYMPEPSPDGKTLAYVGYTSEGFDLFAMPIDETTWTEAPEYVDTRPPVPEIPRKHWDVKPYNPWLTLLPRRYGVQNHRGQLRPRRHRHGGAGRRHGHAQRGVTTVTELEKPELQGSIAYTYARLPVDMGVSVFRSIAPRGGYALGSYRPTVVQETTGFASTLVYSQPRAADARSYVITQSIARTGAELPTPIDKLDPYETPAFPSRGFLSTLHLGYSYTNAERYL